VAGINEGRVAVVTGAGGGIGRAHAIGLAASGAKVVVNDIGAASDGSGFEAGPAQAVVDEIIAAGGEAVRNTDNIATHEGAKALIDQAIEHFGDLHILVNNAGILRDKMMVNMTEADWDSVIAVHLKGTYGPSHHAAAHWRDQSKAGKEVSGSIINTSSASGVFGNVGQANYGAAKAGIAAFTIITSMELARYGVRVNALSPTATTRMTENLAGWEERAAAAGGMPPEGVASVAVFLASRLSEPITGRVFLVTGGSVTVLEGWSKGPSVVTEGIWDPEALATVLPEAVANAAINANMRGERAPATGV
jgi:NAD(P)-dependent dehydrogenase (short-subunit alcohol dehydrogenase family)